MLVQVPPPASTPIKRLSGSFLGACLFFILTNFGVWLLGGYGYTLNGLVASYTMAIPFFVSSIETPASISLSKTAWRRSTRDPVKIISPPVTAAAIA